MRVAYQAGGTRIGLQEYDLADISASGDLATILDDPITQDDDGNFVIPIAAGAASFTVPATAYLQWPLKDVTGTVRGTLLEYMNHIYVRIAESLPTGTFVGVALANNDFENAGVVAMAVGMRDGHIGFHSARPTAGPWTAPTSGNADVACPIAAFQGFQRSSTNSAGLAVCLFQPDGITPSTVSGSATANAAGNWETGEYTRLILFAGRSGVLVEPAVVTARLGSYCAAPARLPGASDFFS